MQWLVGRQAVKAQRQRLTRSLSSCCNWGSTQQMWGRHPATQMQPLDCCSSDWLISQPMSRCHQDQLVLITVALNYRNNVLNLFFAANCFAANCDYETRLNGNYAIREISIPHIEFILSKIALELYVDTGQWNILHLRIDFAHHILLIKVVIIATEYSARSVISVAFRSTCNV